MWMLLPAVLMLLLHHPFPYTVVAKTSTDNPPAQAHISIITLARSGLYCSTWRKWWVCVINLKKPLLTASLCLLLSCSHAHIGYGAGSSANRVQGGVKNRSCLKGSSFRASKSNTAAQPDFITVLRGSSVNMQTDQGGIRDMLQLCVSHLPSTVGHLLI